MTLGTSRHRRKPDKARDLLGLAEVAFRRLAERSAFQRHDALIAFAGRRLIEGDRQIPFSEQGEQRRIYRRLRQPLGVVPHIAAHLAAAIVAHQQVDDAALGLRLQGQLAVAVLKGRSEQRRQRQRLCQQPADHRRVVMVDEDRIEHRPQPHDPAARVTRRDRETEYRIDRTRNAQRTANTFAVAAAITVNARQIACPAWPAVPAGSHLCWGSADGWQAARPGEHGHPITPKHHSNTAFCACRRFSASSQMADCGPSITVSTTSSPRCAGRQ
jgi:hypothetical protein